MRTRSVPHRDMIPGLFDDDGIPTSRCDVEAQAVGLLSIRKTGKARWRHWNFLHQSSGRIEKAEEFYKGYPNKEIRAAVYDAATAWRWKINPWARPGQGGNQPCIRPQYTHHTRVIFGPPANLRDLLGRLGD